MIVLGTLLCLLFGISIILTMVMAFMLMSITTKSTDANVFLNFYQKRRKLAMIRFVLSVIGVIIINSMDSIFIPYGIVIILAICANDYIFYLIKEFIKQ